MEKPFHAGELAIQRRAGSRDQARAVGNSIFATIPPLAARFLARQRLAVAASLDPAGRVWASLLTGPAGFASAVDTQLLHLAAQPMAGDPLATNLAARPELAVLLLDPTTRQRLRCNGRGLLSAAGVFLEVEQVYANCAKYIQLRRARADGEPVAAPATAVAQQLSQRQAAAIAAADTLFVASFHPRGGADASHRGGRAGFVRVEGGRRLSFEHYPGNGVFNTLGNLVEYPRAGLLYVDFTAGDVLQLTGAAQVQKDLSVSLEIEEVRETRRGSPLRYEFVEPSPANPPLSRPTAKKGEDR